MTLNSKSRTPGVCTLIMSKAQEMLQKQCIVPIIMQILGQLLRIRQEKIEPLRISARLLIIKKVRGLIQSRRIY